MSWWGTRLLTAVSSSVVSQSCFHLLAARWAQRANSSTRRLGGNANDNGSSIDDDVLLRSLPYVSGAEFNSSARPDDTTCHQGTRVALLDQIMAWVAARDARHVFWLSGLAGTGKSTIARTVARRCADGKRLGASFFFTRGGGDLASARHFVTTVAAQLAAAVPALHPHIRRAVRAQRNVAALALQDQWARLVLEPMAKVYGGGGSGSVGRRLKPLLRLGRPIVIVVDALDECDDEKETGAVLGLLALGATGQQSWLRVLLTSRPETPIRFGIRRIPSASLAHLVLHELDPPVVDRDIAAYFADNLRNVGTTFMLGSDWPGAETLQQLVKRAGGSLYGPRRLIGSSAEVGRWLATACKKF
jgi:hypothetical protein